MYPRYDTYYRDDNRSEEKEFPAFPSNSGMNVNVSEVKVVGYYSLEKDRTYKPDSSQMSYYKPPAKKNVKFNLDRGIEKLRHKLKLADDNIDSMLKWLEFNHSKIQAPIESKKWIQPDFVCFRGLLSLLLCTPYSNDPWIVCAAKWKGTIYLCEFKIENSFLMTPMNMKFMSWGFKFEKYILSEAPDKSPDPDASNVDESGEFCCMFERQIGNHKILYGAEMDGVCSESKLTDPLPLEDLKFVELKTSRQIEHSGQERTFRKFKLLKWWAQSYLVGIDNILCGFRDDSGIVHNLREYSLPEIIEKSKIYWEPNCCFKFCQDFLTHVSKTVVNDCDKTIYKFERVKSGNIMTTEESPNSKWAFLNSSYLDMSK